jgi:ureidoacrylate peracid hydrolase
MDVEKPSRDEATSPAETRGLRDWVAAHRTAVVAIDMQVDFAFPGGALGKAGLDMGAAVAAVDVATDLVTAARRAGVPIIFVGLATSADTDSPAWREWRRRGGESGDGGLCRSGTPGVDFVGPQPLPDDPVVLKTRYSGFYQTNLDEVLRELGVDTLVLCGLTTECCVDCTARDAFHRDYFVFVADDACAAYSDDVHRSALANLALNCATVLPSSAIAAAWQEAPEQGNPT